MVTGLNCIKEPNHTLALVLLIDGSMKRNWIISFSLRMSMDTFKKEVLIQKKYLNVMVAFCIYNV